MRAVLHQRGFAALWLAQLVSRFGDSIHEIALIWVVYEVTGDATLGIALAGPLVESFGPVPVLLVMSAVVALAGVSGLFTLLVRIGSVATVAEPAD